MSNFEKFVEEVREASGNAWDDVKIGKEVDLMWQRVERRMRTQSIIVIALIILGCVGMLGCGACFVATAALNGLTKGSLKAATTERK